jgi:hypothetical protein
MVPSWNLANNHMIGLPLSNTWLGGGSFLTTPTTKIMYAALIADDLFRLKLNGSILLEIDFDELYFFNHQQRAARTSFLSGNSNTTTSNPYITTDLSPMPSQVNATYNSWHIFPITIPEG